MEKNKISVIIPFYKQIKFVDQCLHSVYSQTYTNWECIIVNDGSPENSDAFFNSWVQKDSRFIYLKQKNKGVSAARNVGIKKSTGEILFCLDADDFIKPNHFQQFIEIFQKNDEVDLIVCDYKLLMPDGSLKKYLPTFTTLFEPKYMALAGWGGIISSPPLCLMYRKQLLFQHDETILFDENITVHEDRLHNAKIFFHAKQVNFLKEELGFYRIHKNSASIKFGLMESHAEKVSIALIKYFDNYNDKMAQFLAREIQQYMREEIEIHKNYQKKQKYIWQYPPSYLKFLALKSTTSVIHHISKKK